MRAFISFLFQSLVQRVKGASFFPLLSFSLPAVLFFSLSASLLARSHRHLSHERGPRNLSYEQVSALVQASGVLLYDATTHKVLFAKNDDVPYAPASTTKLMTALLVYEKTGFKGDVRIKKEDTLVQPSHVPLIAGEVIPVYQLVEELLIGSCNDAALALARACSGSVEKFVEEMNQKAQSLGCLNTHFVNPHGLFEPGQYTTARDLMRIFQAAIKIPAINQICQTRKIHFQNGGVSRVMYNHNRLLGRYMGMGPAKTGWTRISLHTYAAACERNGHTLYLTLLHSPDKWYDARLLFDYGFAQLKPRYTAEEKF
ncbi:D-alanyl-D-alanine carboxypeptidase family protein [Candidatus Methylacidiphilum infernorum]|uniref:D-alanyl-D-alanine carboxypeptidase family protein n=1 Tax=Candidatus Methylacidiphilum infernorum TaxID=511746 RepID=UPI001F5DE6A0|nr:D-alanyl-D-alanine carboxypeptidase family protein [Candidatus Methylacidiphilum infernorum]